MLYIWLSVIIALVLIEFISKNFVAACFVVSAIISTIMTTFTDNYSMEVVVFLIGGIVLITFVRPNLINYLEIKRESKKEEKTETKKEEKKEKKTTTDSTKKTEKKAPKKSVKKSKK